MDPVRASSLRGFQISFLFPVIRLSDRILLSDRGRVVRPRSHLLLERSLLHGTLTRSCPCLSWIEKDCGLDSISISVYSLSRRSIDEQALQIGLNSSISDESMMWKMFDNSGPTKGLTSNLSAVFISFSLLPGFTVTGIHVMFDLDERFQHRMSYCLYSGRISIRRSSRERETTNFGIQTRYETISTQRQRWRDEKWMDTEWRSTFSW